MQTYSEDEQLETLKKWWDEYGKPLIVGAVLAVSVYGGWTVWQDSVQKEQASASDAYQAILDNVEKASDDSLVEQTRAVMDEYPDTVYAHMSALMQAKLQLDAGDLAAAQRTLQWSLDQNPPAGIQEIVQLRQARVLYGQSNYEAALALAGASVAPSFQASYKELEGDIFLAHGEVDKARSAYQSASLAAEKQGQNRPLLKMKLDDLAV